MSKGRLRKATCVGTMTARYHGNDKRAQEHMMKDQIWKDTHTTLREAGGEVALGGSEGSSRGAEEDGRGLHLVGLGLLFVCKKNL